MDYFIQIDCHTDNFAVTVVKWKFQQEVESNGSVLNYAQIVDFVDRFLPAYQLYYKQLAKGKFFKSNAGELKELKIIIDEERQLISHHLI